MTDRFEDHRGHLRGVAYRMLGSFGEADDALQEAWLRLQRADRSDVANLRGWLTTVVARVCLDMLRSRAARREQPLEAVADSAPAPARGAEHELAVADSVGLAMLVVLDKLDPAERIAFVLHDLFAIPFDEIAAIVGRSVEATRQLASRARRRVQGAPPPEAELAEQRATVEAFLAALRRGDVEALIELLDPDVEFRGGARGGPPVRGARNWATGAVAYGRALQHAHPALVGGVGGSVGVAVTPNGKLSHVLRLTYADGVIVAAEAIVDPAAIAALDLAILD